MKKILWIIYERFALWISGWCNIIYGLCVVISFGWWVPMIGLRGEKFYLDVSTEKERRYPQQPEDGR